jgi:hypothetical protein
VSEDPWIVFPGCIQGRHIREAGAKGCVLVTVEDGAVSAVESCPLDVFRWVHSTVDLTGTTEFREVLEIARRSIENHVAAAGGRPIAMRIRFEGATPISTQLSAFPEGFEQQIKAIGAEVAGDDLWIERIENTVIGKLNLESTLTGDSPFGGLLKEILKTSNHPDEISGLDEVIADLRQKIPSEAFGPDSILNFDESQTIERLIDEAKQMLVGRLLTAGEVR